jgi:hypothetical protein
MSTPPKTTPGAPAPLTRTARTAHRFLTAVAIAGAMIAAPATASWALGTGGNGNQGGGGQGSTPTPPSGPTALVTMGDSFIAGEGGRWAGNLGASTLLGYSGPDIWTDRAMQDVGGTYVVNPQAVYGSTWTVPGSTAPGCHRSDTAEANNPNIALAVKVNIACSGAQTINVRPASDGGQFYKGEAPQTDQLAAIARTDRVKLIVLSIGGNDLGFANVVQACVVDDLLGLAPCAASQQAAVMGAMPTAMANVGRTIDDIRYAMALDGYADTDYRLIVQGYPSPLPMGSEMVDPSQRATLGCPVYSADATWTNQTLAPEIDANLKAVADSRGAQFLNTAFALSGHELCSTQAQRFGLTGGPVDSTAEWARMLDTADAQHQSESFHPNAFGQQALARCVAMLYNTYATGDYLCHGQAGYGITGTYLWPN